MKRPTTKYAQYAANHRKEGTGKLTFFDLPKFAITAGITTY